VIFEQDVPTMFQAWRLQLRKARLAVADGRWDEAAEMLATEPLREFLPAKQLSQQLAGQLVERARQRIASGQSTAGWRDLDRAARLGIDEAQIGGLRHEESTRRLEDAVKLLARGDAPAATQSLDRMEARRLGGDERRAWQMIARHMTTAEQSAAKGDVALAIRSLEQAEHLLPVEGSTDVRRHVHARLTTLRDASARQHALEGQLHAALASSNWTEVLAAADALLELAPQHSAARQARHKAWQAVGMEVTMPYRGPLALNGKRFGHARRLEIANPSPSPSLQGRGTNAVNERQAGKRVVAWIDAVGGFLICLGDEIVLGQPSPDGAVDVPILGDVSRRHAIIRRDREAYVLSPLHRTIVDDAPITEPTVLRDKSIIKLGDAVQLRFRKPHALSATAVLEIVSHHRTEPAVDGIVLMSESCILGPNAHSHVQCLDWTSDLVLFRRGEELMCRTHSPIEIDGQTCLGQAPLAGNCRVECDEFALTLEQV
jgi:hypothetical protein